MVTHREWEDEEEEEAEEVVQTGVEEEEEAVQKVEVGAQHGQLFLPAVPRNPQQHDYLLEEEIAGC